ncbi:MAG: hypothetical protein LiPW15_132 [Parcubacteria group bacterium LiPW_15]|nr:MAG: hypothetical protein LiPW15_132 [Parcubacteria group bacterium LiPW_15]
MSEKLPKTKERIVIEERPIFLQGKLIGTHAEGYLGWPQGRLLATEVWKDENGDQYEQVTYERDVEGRLLRKIWANGPAQNPEGDEPEGIEEYLYDASGNLEETRWIGSGDQSPHKGSI